MGATVPASPQGHVGCPQSPPPRGCPLRGELPWRQTHKGINPPCRGVLSPKPARRFPTAPRLLTKRPERRERRLPSLRSLPGVFFCKQHRKSFAGESGWLLPAGSGRGDPAPCAFAEEGAKVQAQRCWAPILTPRGTAAVSFSHRPLPKRFLASPHHHDFFSPYFFFFSFLFPPSFPLRSPGSFRPAPKSFPTVQRALETRAQRGGEGGRGAQLRGQRDAACGHAVGGRGESPHLPGPGRSGQVYGEPQARPLPARSATPGKKAGKTRACRVLSVAARLAAAQPRDVQLMDPKPAAPQTPGIHPAPGGRPPTGPGPPPGEHPGQKGDVKTLWGQLWGGRKAPQGMLSTTRGGGSALWVGKLRQRGAAWSRRGHC